jgi:hypothetical protein
MLCALGVRYKLFFQTDNGSEFGGGGGSRKRAIMEENFMAPLGIKLLSILKGQKEAQSFVERSHRTDDEEFYIPMLPYITSRKTFMTSAKNWVKYYNQKRSHGEREMDGKHRKKNIRALFSLFKSRCICSATALGQSKLTFFELTGVNHTYWDSRHPLYHVIKKQTMPPYTFNRRSIRAGESCWQSA